MAPARTGVINHAPTFVIPAKAGIQLDPPVKPEDDKQR